MILRAAIAALLLSVSATPVLAHAELEKQSPSAGAMLSAAPAEIDLSFSEGLEPAFSGLSVTDDAGHSFAADKAKVDGKAMMLKLKALPAGKYHVKWHAVSLDSHHSQGAYEFTVKN